MKNKPEFKSQWDICNYCVRHHVVTRCGGQLSHGYADVLYDCGVAIENNLPWRNPICGQIGDACCNDCDYLLEHTLFKDNKEKANVAA